MSKRRNVLILMADQMQGRVLDPEHPCQTPELDRLCARGVRVRGAYTPNPICSPARASLMTGLLPHRHGVLTVTHAVDHDQSVLRSDFPHWAQRLVDGGYRTGYFGKWHVERSVRLADFGWQEQASDGDSAIKEGFDRAHQAAPIADLPHFACDVPEGYRSSPLYGVVEQDAGERQCGVVADCALSFLDKALAGDAPWCCFASAIEPHDPFVCTRASFERYDVDALELPANVHHDLAGCPSMYRRSAAAFAQMSDRQRKEAMACYYAQITDLDSQFGRILRRLEDAGVLDETIVVLCSDHGELLGAHGLYCKNIGAFEEAYEIPFVVAGPGLAAGTVCDARVGLHEVGPTLLDLLDLPPLAEADGRSVLPLLRDPDGAAADFQDGFAEFYGSRQFFTQRVLWHGRWKLVHNPFAAEDELYDLDADPGELRNLADDPAHADTLRACFVELWRRINDSGDHTLSNSHYPALRLAPYGPLVGE